MGWCGFSAATIAEMLMTDVLLAYKGKVAMLRFCFAAPEQEAEELDTFEKFTAAFKRDNP